MSTKYRLLLLFVLTPILGLLIQFSFFYNHVNADFSAYNLDQGLTHTQLIANLLADKKTELATQLLAYEKGSLELNHITSYRGTAKFTGEINAPALANKFNTADFIKIIPQLKNSNFVPFFLNDGKMFAITPDPRKMAEILVFELEDIGSAIDNNPNMDLVLAGKTGVYSSQASGSGQHYFFTDGSFLSKLASHPSPSAFPLQTNSASWIVSTSPVGNSDLLLISGINSNDQTIFGRILFYRLLLVLLGIGVILAGIGYYFAQSFIAPINYLVEALDKVGTGDFEFKLTYDKEDEFGRLSKRFNQMMEAVRTSLKKQEDLTRMKSELDTANIVQRLFNNAAIHNYDNISVAGTMLTASECGGDFWTHFENNNRIFVFLGDATGHGTPAALVTSAVCATLHNIKTQPIISAEACLHALNESLYLTTKGEIYMTMIAVMIDKNTNTIEISNAGHVPCYQIEDVTKIKKWNECNVLGDAGSPVGRSRDFVVKSQKIPLTKNLRLILLTDGFFDVENTKGNKMNDRALIQIILDAFNKVKTNSDVCRFIKSTMTDKLQGGNPPDDITLISIAVD